MVGPFVFESRMRATESFEWQIYAFDWSKDGKRLAAAHGNEMNDVVLINRFSSE